MSINRGTDKDDVVAFNGILLSHNKELNWVICRGLDWPKGFPDSSVGKESACNAGDPRSIPGSGRSAEKGIGYPLQYSWASLVVQLVKNLPAMRESWVRSLGWEDPLEKGKVTHSSILAGRIPWTLWVPCCIAHGTDLETATKSKVSQKEKNKYHILMHICGI